MFLATSKANHINQNTMIAILIFAAGVSTGFIIGCVTVFQQQKKLVESLRASKEALESAVNKNTKPKETK